MPVDVTVEQPGLRAIAGQAYCQVDDHRRLPDTTLARANCDDMLYLRERARLVPNALVGTAHVRRKRNVHGADGGGDFAGLSLEGPSTSARICSWGADA